jgi:hypothetical protein
LNAGEQAAARTAARLVAGAVRAAANGDDPLHGAAVELLQGLVGDALPPPDAHVSETGAPLVTGTVFDDEGNLMPGWVDAQAPASQQFEQLSAALARQGLNVQQASSLALQGLAASGADLRTARGYFVPDEAHEVALAAVRQERAESALAEQDPGPEAGEHEVDLPAGERIVIVGQRISFADALAERVGGAAGALYERGKALGAEALQAAAEGLSVLDIPALQVFQGDVRGYLNRRAEAGGLSEAEMVLFGALYAANEALMPTSALDFAGAAGKGIGAAAAAIRAGGRAEDIVQVVRAESRALAQATEARVAEVADSARREGLELITERGGVRGDWNPALNQSLKPNAVYLLDSGHVYKTDAAGRVVQAEATLEAGKVDRNAWQQLLAGREGGQGYDGGHLIATLFGGAGEKINLVPQLSTVNRGEFREMERQWALALDAKQVVRVEVRPVYSDHSRLPSLIDVQYSIDGKPYRQTFGNITENSGP